MRWLNIVRKTRATDILQTRLNSSVEIGPHGEKRLSGPRPGPRSLVTAEMYLLAMFLCAEFRNCYRRSELVRMLLGLHDDVAREVGLMDRHGNRKALPYKTLVYQAHRIESVLHDGWTAPARQAHPDKKHVRYDMSWFIREFLRASIPRDARESDSPCGGGLHRRAFLGQILSRGQAARRG